MNMERLDEYSFSIKGEGVRDPKIDKKNLDDFIDKILMDELNQPPEILEKNLEISKLMTRYLSLYGKSLEDDCSDVVNPEFMVSDALDAKIRILRDAIEKGILLNESVYYSEIQEGAKGEDHFFR